MSILSRDARPVIRPVPKPKPPSPRKPLTPAAIAFRWLSRPILPTTPTDAGWSGLLMIGVQSYLVTFHLAANGDDLPGVIGWRLTKHDGTFYDLDTAFTCDCGDATFRGERPGGCKHSVNLKAALQQIGVIDREQPRPEPTYDAFECDQAPEYEVA